MTLKNSYNNKIEKIKTLCKENFTKLQRMKNTKSIKSTIKNNFIDNINHLIVSSIYKKWIFIVKTVKNIQVTRFQKN